MTVQQHTLPVNINHLRGVRPLANRRAAFLLYFSAESGL